MKDRVAETLDRLAKCSWILQAVKRLGLPPRPPELAKKDAADFKRDVLYILKRMPGGNTEANRKLLHEQINEMVKFLNEHDEDIRFTPRKKKK